VTQPRALVTGSAGFLGRHLSAALRASGWQVWACDIAGDPSGGTDCRQVFYDTDHTGPDYDLVIHAAAIIGGRQVIDGNPLATAENLELDAAMFRWAATHRPGRVLYLSSSAVYPVQFQTASRTAERLVEAHANPAGYVGAPDQVYGWSKLMGEVLADRARQAGVPVTVVRPFSGYGPGQALSYPFAAFADRVRRREDPFTIWGDGTQTRDWIHVHDLVSAILTLIGGGEDGPVNLCTGRPTSFNELARLFFAAAGWQPARVAYQRAAPQGVAWRVGDPTRLHPLYRPTVALEDGIAEALAPASH
jgi:nucleoside-diphosphate-sugar epimerase